MGLFSDNWFTRAGSRIADGDNWAAAGSAVLDAGKSLGGWAKDTAVPWVGNAVAYTGATVGGPLLTTLNSTISVVARTPYAYVTGGHEAVNGVWERTGRINNKINEMQREGLGNIGGYAVYVYKKPGEAGTDLVQGAVNGVVTLGGLVVDVGGATVNGVAALGAKDTNYQVFERDSFLAVTSHWNKSTQFASKVQDDDSNAKYRNFTRIVGEVPGFVVASTVTGGAAGAAWAGARSGAALVKGATRVVAQTADDAAQAVAKATTVPVVQSGSLTARATANANASTASTGASASTSTASAATAAPTLTEGFTTGATKGFNLANPLAGKVTAGVEVAMLAVSAEGKNAAMAQEGQGEAKTNVKGAGQDNPTLSGSLEAVAAGTKSETNTMFTNVSTGAKTTVPLDAVAFTVAAYSPATDAAMANAARIIK